MLAKAIKWAAALAFFALAGCAESVPYGVEKQSALPPGSKPAVWAVAPAVNLSGQSNVDPLLQADTLYAELQQVRGLTVLPVDRVAQVYAALRIGQVESADQAALVCDLLGADALVVPTVTAFDPYNPPRMGAGLQLFLKQSAYGKAKQPALDPHALGRAAAPDDGTDAALPSQPQFEQAIGIFDATNGSVRAALDDYVSGRNDPSGPLKGKLYLVDMDRYAGFVYHQLIEQLLASPKIINDQQPAIAAVTPPASSSLPAQASSPHGNAIVGVASGG